MKVICILGVGCSGKTTHCKKLLDDYKREDKHRPLLLTMGKFCREIFGPDFFAQLDNPAAPEITECWIRYTVSFGILVSVQSDRQDVILDGFPRTREQFHWLMLSSPASEWAESVEMYFLNVSNEVLEARVLERMSANSDEMNLVNKRMVKDKALFDTMKGEIMCAVDGKRYPKLKVLEVND